jgi:hypothetical protein
MQFIEQEKQARSALSTEIEKLSQITPESLVRTDDLGRQLDFSKGTDVFKRVLGLFKDLKESNLDNVSYQALTNLTQMAQDANNRFQQIRSFNPGNQNNPSAARDGLVQSLGEYYHQYFNTISPIIAYSVRKGTDFERLEEDAQRHLAEIEKVKVEQQKQAASLLAEVQSTLDKVRKAAAEVGVAQHSIHFKEQATEHLESSKTWLRATIGLAVLTLLYSVAVGSYYLFGAPQMTASQAVQLGIAKLFIFSVLYFATLWAARMYKAHWHNYVVNKHRQNALSTFETFVKAASDDQTKNAVLVQATQSIFSQVQSGFVTADTEAGASPQILEIVRSVTGDKTPGH